FPEIMPADIASVEKHRNKAEDLEDDKMRTILTRSFDVLKSVQIGNIKDIEYQLDSMNNERAVALKYDKDVEAEPLRSFIYGISEAIERTFGAHFLKEINAGMHADTYAPMISAVEVPVISVVDAQPMVPVKIEDAGPIDYDQLNKTAAAVRRTQIRFSPRKVAPAPKVAAVVPAQVRRVLVQPVVPRTMSISTRVPRLSIAKKAAPTPRAKRVKTPAILKSAAVRAPIIPPVLPQPPIDNSVPTEPTEEPLFQRVPEVKQEAILDSIESQVNPGVDGPGFDVDDFGQGQTMAGQAQTTPFQMGMTLNSMGAGNAFMDAAMAFDYQPGTSAPRMLNATTQFVPSTSFITNNLPLSRKRKVVQTETPAPRARKEENEKTLFCPFQNCQSDVMDVAGVHKHFLDVHHTTPAKSRYQFACTCGYLDTKDAKFHKYSCRKGVMSIVYKPY
ncbi:hypothetical protein PENTCL1PPCAC_28986, partial [Pristionchus entomophagus]